MPDRPLEMARFEAISDCGEKFTICQLLRITRMTFPTDCIGSRVKPYWQTDTGIKVQKQSDSEFLVLRGNQWITVRRADAVDSTGTTLSPSESVGRG